MKISVYRSLAAAVALTAPLLATPNQAMAVPILTIVIDPITLSGVGGCKGPDLSPSPGANLPVPDFSGNCWDLVLYPKDPTADQILLTGDTYILDNPPFPLSPGKLTFTYIPGSTGGGSAGPEADQCAGGVDNPFVLDRPITVNGVPGTLTQSGTLRVGWCFDTLNIGLGTATVQNVPNFGTVTVTVGGVVNLEASLDPEGDLPVNVDAISTAAVPIPSTLALVAVGLLGFARRQISRGA